MAERLALADLSDAGLATPALYPLDLSPEGSRVRCVRLAEPDYRSASFLDQRLLRTHTSEWGDWQMFRSTPRPTRAHLIFHLGHVGSTLLSRLLGEHPALFSMREPALLRELAAGRWPERTDTLLALFARVWRPGQTALIKATSLVSEIGPELAARTDPGRILLLSAAPLAYLRTILAGPASREEAEALAGVRQGRLQRRLGAEVEARTPGERILMGWLAEVLSLAALADLYPQRCLWLDFDQLLATPAVVLEQGFLHLGVEPAALDIAGLVEGPILRRYSKAPEHAYDAALRRRLLEAAGRDEALEVQRAMAWLQRMADAHPSIRPALQRVADARRGPLAAPPPAS